MFRYVNMAFVRVFVPFLVFFASALGQAKYLRCPPFQAQTLEQRRTACQTQLKAYNCENQFKNNPNQSALVSDCSDEELNANLGQSSSDWVIGCLKGLNIHVDNVKDAWRAIYKLIAEMNAALDKVSTPAEKRELVADVPYLARLSDQELSEYSAYELTIKAEMARDNQKTAEITNVYTGVVPVIRPDELSNVIRNDVDGPHPGQAVLNFVSKAFAVNPSCLKPQPRAAYQCFIMSTALSAGLTAGGTPAVVRSVALSKLAKQSKPLYELLKSRGIIRAEKTAVAVVTPENSEKMVASFVAEYRDKKPTDVFDNARFAGSMIARREGEGGVIVAQNALLKRINTASKDPAVADAVNNRYREILFRNEKELSKKYGISAQCGAFFKEGGVNACTSDSAMYQEYSRELHQRTMREFTADRQVQAVLEKYDIPVEEVMRTGEGPNHIWAQWASRKARENKDPYALTRATDPNVRESLRSGLKDIDRVQAKLGYKFRNTEVMDAVVDERFGGTRWVPSQKTLELVRKYKSEPQVLKAKLEKIYHRPFADRDVVDFTQYSEKLNDYSYDSVSLSASSLSIPRADHGVIAIDLPGIGAANQRELAKELSSTHADLGDAVKASLRAESVVTQKLESIRADFRDTTWRITEGKAEVLNSGDDIYIVAREPLTKTQRDELVAELSKLDGYGPPRFSTVGPMNDVRQAEGLLQDGLAIEKTIKDDLTGAINWRKMENVSLHFDMRSRVTGRGPIEMRIETRNGVTLSSQEEELIRNQFAPSLRRFNADPNNRTSYSAFGH